MDPKLPVWAKCQHLRTTPVELKPMRRFTLAKKRPMARDSGCARRARCTLRSSQGVRRHRPRPMEENACIRASLPMAVLYVEAATPSTTMLPVKAQRSSLLYLLSVLWNQLELLLDSRMTERS